MNIEHTIVPGDFVLQSRCGEYGCTSYYGIVTSVRQSPKGAMTLNIQRLESRKTVEVPLIDCQQVGVDHIKSGLVGLCTHFPNTKGKREMAWVKSEHLKRDILYVRLISHETKRLSKHIKASELTYFVNK